MKEKIKFSMFNTQFTTLSLFLHTPIVMFTCIDYTLHSPYTLKRVQTYCFITFILLKYVINIFVIKCGIDIILEQTT